ncbi:MAG: hypothetical protein WBM90_14095, partial [Acidimicrobiia bacterium]
MNSSDPSRNRDVAAAEHSPEDDARLNRRKAIRELILMGIVLFLIFVVFLPQFIDYGQVVDSLLQLSIGQIALLTVLALPYMWLTAGVSNVLIP